MSMRPSPRSQPPEVGQPIFCADNETIGYVKEVVGEHFKVDAPGRPDYWLRCADLTHATSNQYILNFPREELGEHELDAPGPGARAEGE